MFTGIITHLGKVAEKTESRLTVESDPDFIKKLNLGASVAVNGICLTVVSQGKNSFEIDFMPETLERTNIKYLRKGSFVNLELSATIKTLFSGHFVQGHVDAVAKIVNIRKKGNSRILAFSMPRGLSKYIVEKGSIAVSGVSLTVLGLSSEKFFVGIIPHTWEKTTFHRTKVGDWVNIEVDVFAKYVEKLLHCKN